MEHEYQIECSCERCAETSAFEAKFAERAASAGLTVEEAIAVMHAEVDVALAILGEGPPITDA